MSKFARMGRIGGLVNCVLRGTLGDSQWGRHMSGHHAGKANATHGLEHMRTIYPLGVKARLANAELRRRRAQYEADQAKGLVP